MRSAANRAMQQADPSARSAPASFNQEKSVQQARAASATSSSAKLAQQQQDMELRSLLTKLQNDMGIHPTEHMSLEEVRTNNPDYYNQLLEFHAASKVEQASSVRGPAATSAPPQRTRQQPPPPQQQQQQASVARDPRRPAPPHDPRAGRARAPPPQQQVAPPPSQAPRAEPPRQSAAVRKSDDGSAAKSSNVAHLMQLLKRKQRAPSPPQQPVQEITNDPPRAPDAAAVMSILQKLKGLSNGGTSSGPSPPQAQPQQVQQPQQQQGDQQQQAPPSDNASRMWFSDKVVAHKDRVESNVQKLYAALPLVCRESGLRFREQAQLDAHLDFLFQYNRARKERGKGGVSRSWYPDEDQWVADFSGDTAPRESTSSSFFDRTQKEKEKNAGEQASWENARVPVDETITRCRICGENFRKAGTKKKKTGCTLTQLPARSITPAPMGTSSRILSSISIATIR
ncbi:hypothetical protein ON010_g4732 [Phytophthora cinnamomi]|nr:hypothetical protein ON010_g4732 [Phytophthora cinnamomi]